MRRSLRRGNVESALEGPWVLGGWPAAAGAPRGKAGQLSELRLGRNSRRSSRRYTSPGYISDCNHINTGNPCNQWGFS